MTEPAYDSSTILEGADTSVDPTAEQMARGAAGDQQAPTFASAPLDTPAAPVEATEQNLPPVTTSNGPAGQTGGDAQVHVRQVTDGVKASDPR